MLRIGIIGIGTIANTYIKLIVEGKIKGQLRALSSRNRENMQKVIDQYTLEDVICFENYKQLLKSQLIDLVIICTPHQTHIEIAREALACGIHTLIEKPIDIDLERAEAFLLEQEKYPHLICGVAYCNRVATGYQKVKQMLEQEAIGKLKRASYTMTKHYRTMAYHHSAPWRGTYAAEGGGVLMTQASHQLDILLWLCGIPKKVKGFCYIGENRQIEVENEAYIHMEFEEGARGQFTASTHELPGIDRLELHGEKGQIILEDGYELTYTKLAVSEPEFAHTSKGWFGDIEKEVKRIPTQKETVEAFQGNLINDFIEAVEQNRPPICTVREAVQSLRVIKAAYAMSNSRFS